MDEQCDVWTLKFNKPVSRKELSVALVDALLPGFDAKPRLPQDPFSRRVVTGDEILAVLQGGKMTRRDLCQKFKQPVAVMTEELATLVMNGKITVSKHKPARGRPTAYYELVVADGGESV